jgi:hypothetical protein
MIEKIACWVSAIAGFCIGLFMMILGTLGLRPFYGFWSWFAMLTIFIFSMTAIFICCLPLLGSFEKTNTEPFEIETPDEPEIEKVKLGFFAPFQLI